MHILIYLGLLVILMGYTVLKVYNWLVEEEANLKREKLAKAIDRKQLIAELAADVKKAMESDSEMSSDDIAHFIESYDKEE